MKYLFFIILSVVSFFSLQARIDQQCVATAAMLSSIVTDKFQYNVLGSQEVSSQLALQAQKLFKELGMHNPEKIKVMRMSPVMRCCIGNETAAATHTAIFVDEEWLLKLSPTDRAFVLAHEAMHIKNKDLPKKLALFLAPIIPFAGLYALGVTALSALSVASSCVALQAAAKACVRSMEARADAGAEHIVGAFTQATGCAGDHQSLQEKIVAWITSWFSEYHADRFDHIH